MSLERYVHRSVRVALCASPSLKTAVEWSGRRTLVSARRIVILVSFERERSRCWSQSKTFVKTFPQCGFLTQAWYPNMLRENGTLYACHSMCIHCKSTWEKIYKSKTKQIQEPKLFCRNEQKILCHRDRNLTALDVHPRRFIFLSWDEVLVLACKFCLNKKKY